MEKHFLHFTNISEKFSALYKSKWRKCKIKINLKNLPKIVSSDTGGASWVKTPSCKVTVFLCWYVKRYVKRQCFRVLPKLLYSPKLLLCAFESIHISSVDYFRFLKTDVNTPLYFIPKKSTVRTVTRWQANWQRIFYFETKWTGLN